jgi:Flp pilus assembly protein TadD
MVKKNFLENSSISTGDAEALIKSAGELFWKEDWVALLQLSEKWVQKMPKSPDAHYFFGVAQFKRRCVKQAIATLEKCLELNPEHARAWDQLGVIICQQRNAADALPHHEKATSLAPDNSNLWFNLGVAYSANADDANAERAFSRAIELSGPEKTLVRRLFAAQINQQKHSEAEKVLSELRTSHPAVAEGIVLPDPAMRSGHVYGPSIEMPPQPTTTKRRNRAVFQGKELPDDEHGLIQVVHCASPDRKNILLGVCIGAAAVVIAYLLFWIFVMPQI